MKKKTKTLLTALAVPLGVGAVSGFLTQGSMDTFEKLKQPPLTPPGWVFPVVWTGLFAMMGTASYLVAISPKTEKSNRTIKLPNFLCDEIQDYLKMLYDVGLDDRMFPVTKSYLYREMERGSKQAGVKRIRIHDIRHSHVSLLIDMGFSATAIADRVGHESIEITYNYAHLFPSKQTEMADKLEMERGR